MIVAVNPNFRGVGAAIKQPLFTHEYFLLSAEDLLCFISKYSGEVRQLLFQKSKRPPQCCAHCLVNRTLRHGVERLRSKRRIIQRRCQREMQFARSEEHTSELQS